MRLAPLSVAEADDPALVSFVAVPDAAWRQCLPTDRRREIEAAGRALNTALTAGPTVLSYRSMDLVGGPYPTRYGLRDAADRRRIGPFLHIRNRLFVFEVASPHGRRIVLGSPTHHRGGGVSHTPFFHRLERRLGPAARVLRPWLTTDVRTVQEALAEIGVRPEDVDYLTYDHLHVQDLRPWLGTDGLPGFFPRARLLVGEREWNSARGPLAPQRDWYCPGGCEGLPLDRVITFTEDLAVGQGLVLLRTPGHTEGNHSLVAATPHGVWVTSENGVSPDCYAPVHSRLPGVARHVQATGMDVVLNANTLERGLDQYLSMVLERAVASPWHRDDRFPSILCSSELTPHGAYPGIHPTLVLGEQHVVGRV